LFSEINKDAAATYRINRAVDVQYEPDVKGLAASGLETYATRRNVKEIDLVCGGPPCQGYSGIGHRRSYKVDKKEIPSNHLFLDMISVIKDVRPKLFLFENVKGLMSGRWTEDGEKGEIWRDVKAAFMALEDYGVFPTLVQAKDYGVPQNRPRVLIAGIRRDIAAFPGSGADAVKVGALPAGGSPAPNLIEVLSDLIDPDYEAEYVTRSYLRNVDPKAPYQELMRRSRDGEYVSKAGDPVTEMEYSRHSPQIKAKFEYMLANGGAIREDMRTKKFAQRILPEVWGDGGPNITATSLPDDFVHFAQPRTPTVREWARLQAFPDWYRFAGPRTTGGVRRAGNPHTGIWEREVPKYTQIGNAVPVQLAHAIGQHFIKLLNG
jgi:DNA (cytosine-5)-methyltransferase 1